MADRVSAAVRRMDPPYVLDHSHRGVFYGTATATWLRCEGCGIETRHRRNDVPSAYHVRAFRRLHKAAAASTYVGARRATP